MPYVIAQFALIFLLAWPPLPLVFTSWALFAGASLFLLGLALFAWAYVSLPRVSFTVLPQPREGNQLGMAGPYRWVRHPMYSAVLFCGLGAALAYGQWWKWLCLALLAAVLWLKLRLEERALVMLHPEYAAYRERTKALIVGLL